MNDKDLALTCPNPRLISAIYFGLLSVVGTILINAFLTTLGYEEKIPVFASVLIGMVVASCTGAVFGEQIIHCPKPYKLRTFLIGFIMVIASLPFFTLGILFLIEEESTHLISISQLHGMVYLYLYMLAYSYLLFGVELAVGAGLAAMYLRGQLVYDILATYQPDDDPIKLPDSPLEKSRLEHSDKVSIKHK